VDRFIDTGAGPVPVIRTGWTRSFWWGGSTRIPMVSRMLSGELNIEPEIGIDPDLCVALGAGILDQAREKLPLALKRSGEADSLYRYAGFLAGWQSGWDMPER
jgi:hypothetical protein